MKTPEFVTIARAQTLFIPITPEREKIAYKILRDILSRRSPTTILPVDWK